MSRDCRVTEALLSKGWSVLRFWESDIQDNLDTCVATTLATLRGEIDSSQYSLLAHRSVAEFFAGIGLMRRALEDEGWSVPFANDIDEKKYEMYGENFPNAESDFLLDDIWKLSAERIPTVSLATASFPCNDLSLAGACRGLSGKHSSAYWRFIAILKELDERKPPLILIENVLGLMRSNQGNDFREALLALNLLGYSVDAFMLDASSFVPQSRPRLFVVGILSDGEDTDNPFDVIRRESVVRPKSLMKFILSNRDIRWRLRVLPEPEPASKPLEAILEDLPEDSAFWWNDERAEYLLNQMSPRHRRIAEQMMTDAEWSYGTVFRRVRKGRSMAELRTDGIAGCLRTPRGGSGRQILFRAGKGRYSVRLLTSRECARLMGADDYKITVPLNQALFGFGDAVCVQVIRWIAKYYLNPVVAELLHGEVLRPSDAEWLR
ncbi:DNA (cytosine-5-)-methyltransferase [bacterium]|nr:DNA (cytosine-5-)-methyltransferase [bacterium]